MNKYAVMPLSDYTSACDKIREKTETTGTIVSGEWANKVDEVYEAGVEAGKAQGGAGGFSLNGTYILKEPITSEDLIVGGFEEYFPADSVYAYFYDSKINDYIYLPIQWLYSNDAIYDWNTTDGDINHSKTPRDGKWGYYWYNDSTGESGEGLYPDIKGRIIVFTKPTVVSEDFYNLFMATTNGAEENFDEGKQAEYDRFWDAFQENGERTNYANAFYGFYWNKETLRPKYTCKVVGDGGSSMFARCYMKFPPPDPSDLLDMSNIPIDVTEATYCGSMFENARVDNVTLIFGDKIESLYNAFTKGGGGNVAGMHITLLVPNPDCDWNNAFAYHPVKELNLLDGTVIGTDGFNVQWATGLSKENLTSIINALSDSTSELSITISKGAVAEAFRTAGSNHPDGWLSEEWKSLVTTKPFWNIILV